VAEYMVCLGRKSLVPRLGPNWLSKKNVFLLISNKNVFLNFGLVCLFVCEFPYSQVTYQVSEGLTTLSFSMIQCRSIAGLIPRSLQLQAQTQ
jgi:hypothetical protein